ncbi:MAG: hypothetical protein NC548_31775 [Lachnospiraceae bacterium]|nr:hypothetical protein [Lachnospiraceae bacterium]
MKKLIASLGGMDKVAHFGIAAVIADFITIVCLLQDISSPLHWNALGYCAIGTVVAIILALIKEFIIDEKIDWRDIMASALGTIPLWIAVAIGIGFNIIQCARVADTIGVA